MKKISVFIPARNEEGNIEELLEKVDNAFQSLKNYKCELIMVNDGSTDKTGELLESAKKKYDFLKVFHHRKGQGLTQAMKTGFEHVTGEFVLFLPADLESDPEEDIPKLTHSLVESNLDVVTGWRQGRGDGKNLSSFIYNAISRSLFGVKVHDMNWIKGFKRELLDDLELRSDWHRFIIMMAANKGYTIGEVKTSWHHRKAGKSKFGLMRFPIALVDTLVVKFNMVFGSKPMHFFSMIGLFVMLAGFIGLVFLAYHYLVNDTQIRPLFTLSTTLLIAGIQLFVTGFLAEIVVSQKDEISEIRKKMKAFERKSPDNEA
ncbi:MAG: glycosyltransferase family 2 protein [Candidatus Delongbacteria bacterium]|nr:glycosyltransferase family 2 protein [Candidatus Delongbacteria bacterium]MBN2833399.1 glycosyltransferase family 2 protein [Candidatus Delongbacteria bacterium]